MSRRGGFNPQEVSNLRSWGVEPRPDEIEGVAPGPTPGQVRPPGPDAGKATPSPLQMHADGIGWEPGVHGGHTPLPLSPYAAMGQPGSLSATALEYLKRRWSEQQQFDPTRRRT